MSFSTLKVDPLRKLAEEFAVDLEPGTKKEEIIAALAENGVTYEQASELHPNLAPPTSNIVSPPTEKAEERDENESEYLIKMVGENPTFEVRGYKFTKDFPILVVKEKDANAILNMYGDKFRMAAPEEAKSFYS